jgi:hypothetical protein
MDEFRSDLLESLRRYRYFQRIASRVPGFSGYIERTKQRDSDKLVRR